jgi:hypothetical protein
MKSSKVLCPTWKQAVAWGLREMGSVWGKGVKAGLDRQKGEKIKQSMPSEGWENMEKDEEEQASQT